MELKTKKIIFFDFDGTIADTLKAFMMVNNNHYKEYGTKYITDEDVPKLKHMKDFEILRYLDINVIEFFLISRKFLKQVSNFMPSAPVFDGMLELLTDLHNLGHVIVIVSRNSVPNIKKFFKANKVEHMNNIYSEGFFTKKDKIIDRVLKRHKLTIIDAVLIGDRLTDFESAKKAEIDYIYVSWGYGVPSKEQAEELKYRVDSPLELRKLLI